MKNTTKKNATPVKETVDKNFTQLCVWQGCLLPDDDSEKGTGVEQFVKFMKDSINARIKFAEQVTTLPGDGGEGGRNDLLFYIHADDISGFAVRRFEYGHIRWWEDIFFNKQQSIYPTSILKKYPKTW